MSELLDGFFFMKYESHEYESEYHYMMCECYPLFIVTRYVSTCKIFLCIIKTGAHAYQVILCEYIRFNAQCTTLVPCACVCLSQYAPGIAISVMSATT